MNNTKLYTGRRLYADCGENLYKFLDEIMNYPTIHYPLTVYMTREDFVEDILPEHSMRTGFSYITDRGYTITIDKNIVLQAFLLAVEAFATRVQLTLKDWLSFATIVTKMGKVYYICDIFKLSTWSTARKINGTMDKLQNMYKQSCDESHLNFLYTINE